MRRSTPWTNWTSWTNRWRSLLGVIPRRFSVLFLVLLLVQLAAGPALPASAAIFARTDCSEQIAASLTLALPLEVGELERAQLEDVLRSAFEKVRPAVRTGAEDRCAGKGRLQLHLTLGSRYQILDWLAQGEVDGAVVSVLMTELLARDGVGLIALEMPEGRGVPWGGPVIPVLAARGWHDGEFVPLPDPDAQLARYREQLWCRALAAAGSEAVLPPAPQDCDGELATRIFRPVMPSHLDSGGFTAPVAALGGWLDQRMGELLRGADAASGEPKDLAPRLRAAFWSAFFDDLRLSLDHDPLDRLDPGTAGAAGSAVAPLDLRPPPVGAEVVELLFSGSAGSLDLSEAADGEPGRARISPQPPAVAPDVLALLPGTAATLVSDRLRPLRRSLPAGFPGLPEADRVHRYRQRSPVDDPAIAASWAAMAERDRYFGARTFDFTADEALRLLRLHRPVPDSERLALVLPGGGVKAAYQSVFLDELYGTGALRNRHAAFPDDGAGATAGAGALAVDQVVGTSGGSLIGYFVAQLDTPGRPRLSQVLWQRADGGAMTSTDVFGWLDQLRWLSLVVIFGVFCLILIAVRLRRRTQHRQAAPNNAGIEPDWRPAVLWAFGPLLVLTPLVVRWLSGDASREQVPEIEGLLYAVLVWLAMLADQCLVRRSEAKTGLLPPAFSVTSLVVLGSLMAALPVLVVLLSKDPRLPPASFGLTYFALGVFLVFGAMALPRRARQLAGGSASRVLWPAFVDFALCAGAVLALPALNPGLPAGSLFQVVGLAALASMAVIAVVSVLMRRRNNGGPRRPWVDRLYYPAMILVCALLALLAAPDRADGSWLELVQRPSALAVGSGSLVFVLGALALAVAFLFLLHQGPSAYRLEGVADYGLALAVVLAHGLLSYLVLLVVTILPWPHVTTLELTWEFWLTLLLAGLLVGLGLVLLARRERVAGRVAARLVGFLRRGLDFLGDRHPNGVLVVWRFLRLAAVAITFLGWWNFVVAPALYGNSSAEAFLRQVQGEFQRQLGAGGGVGQADGVSLPRFTATFVTPANKLETDGTRFFTFVPIEDACPTIGAEPGSGSQWLAYRVGSPRAAGEEDAPLAGACECFSVSDPEFFSDVIFASGSPFPIFAAHRVDPLCGRDPMLMVDGGYSNNVPVEAARELEAGQVLILRSSHPLGHPAPSAWFGDTVGTVAEIPGQLVRNLGPLTGFLFERSQRSDRLSGRELLVVSMAPRRKHAPWPRLFDFRAEVVDRMRRLACEDLGAGAEPPCRDLLGGVPEDLGHRPPDDPRRIAHRIALVESWGRPSIDLTLEVPEIAFRSLRD